MQRTIAVGVGGASGLRALAWAADEAAGPQDRLVLLRACPSCSPLAGLVGEPPVPLLERANRGLVRAIATTGIRREGQRRFRVLVGDPATALADASASADLLVIGATAGAVAAQIVRHTHCPLVVVHPVPAEPGDPFAGHVVVGVGGGDALDFAFGYAAAHRLPVAAVRVTVPGAELLDSEVEPWELKYPQVRVRHAIAPGDPADRLIEAAAGARLLVIGGPTSDLTRAVTAHARCPVTVVPLPHDGAAALRTGVEAPPGRGSTRAPGRRR